MARCSRLGSLVIGSLLTAVTAAAAQSVQLPDLGGRLVDPLQSAAQSKATVLLFISSDCPISNRYAPAIQRLHDTFTSQGVRFWLVYPNPADSAAVIGTHRKDYRYTIASLRDPQHHAVKLAKVTITPEAAVYDRDKKLVYRGRIDDRYVSLGLERPAPTKHDLQDALSAVVAGRPVPQATAPAVGCFIADFAQ